MQTRASPNHRKVMKAEPSGLIPKTIVAKLELLIVVSGNLLIFLNSNHVHQLKLEKFIKIQSKGKPSFQTPNQIFRIKRTEKVVFFTCFFQFTLSIATA